jgi:hypothetical protein
MVFAKEESGKWKAVGRNGLNFALDPLTQK